MCAYDVVWRTEYRPGTWTVSRLLRYTPFALAGAIVDASCELCAVSMQSDGVSRGVSCKSPWQECAKGTEHYLQQHIMDGRKKSEGHSGTIIAGEIYFRSRVLFAVGSLALGVIDNFRAIRRRSPIEYAESK